MAQTTIENTFIDVAGKKTQLTKAGSGPPLLYLHSAGSETEWNAFHELLAEQYTVYLPAHPGFALSEGLDKIDDMQDLVWHYVDLLGVLDLDRVPIFGYSLGAWLALELTVHRPELVSQLVLVDAAGLHINEAPMAELFIDDLDELRELLFFDPNSPAVEEAMPTSLDDPRILNWLRAREATARLGWNPYLHNPKLRNHLHRIQCPTQIIWGREDKLIPLAHGEYYAENIQGARLEVIDQCGHMVPYEAREKLAEMTLAALK